MFSYNLVDNKIIINSFQFKETFKEFNNIDNSLIQRNIISSLIYIDNKNDEDIMATELRAMAIYYCVAHLVYVACGGENITTPDTLSNMGGGLVKEAKQGEVNVKKALSDDASLLEKDFSDDWYGRQFLSLTSGININSVIPNIDNNNYNVVY